MNANNIDHYLVMSRPEDSMLDTDFTARVMEGLPSLVSSDSSSRRRHLFPVLTTRLRHAPKFAVVLMVLFALTIVSGAAFAVVQTITTQNIKVEGSGVNQFGREQLQVSFDKCNEEKKQGTIYELKKNSKLSADDGVKVLQARCEIDVIEEWLKNDQATRDIMKATGGFRPTFTRTTGTIKTLNVDSVTFQNDITYTFPASARVVESNDLVARGSLHEGDNVMYFSPHASEPATYGDPASDVVIFKLSLPTRYYGLDLQSYVRTRVPCVGNAQLECLAESNINSVFLKVSLGGEMEKQTPDIPSKQLQGKVVSYDDATIKLDAGNGKIYTIATPSNIIGTYNKTTVYGLKDLDWIYSHTNPDDLKILSGDTLEVYYVESSDKKETTIPWSDVVIVSLKVERTTDNMDVLEKY